MRGTGYVAFHASWEDQAGRRIATFPVDQGAHPWGPDGGPYADDSIPAPQAGEAYALYLRRYAGGGRKPAGVNGDDGRGIGWWVEAWGLTVNALRRWYAQRPAEHQAQWDGEPTVQELFDACFSQSRNGSFYASGGGVVVIASAENWKSRRHLLDGAMARGELRLGGVWTVFLPGHTRATEFLIQWMPGDVVVNPVEPEEPEEPELPIEKPLSSVSRRVEELESLIAVCHLRFIALFRANTGKLRWWLLALPSSLLDAVTETGLLRLALTELVRAKRKLHGEPEEGR